ncbi:MAG: polyamine aminopropyltransferase [Acidobacteriota bacterium]|nr:polyamine aminopropyltransferase [Acidobacteriota bacterium]
MSLITKDGKLYFFEDLYPDLTYGFEVSNVLVPETDTGFQKLMILETNRFGKVLVLDGIVQLTEEDEGIYHEWISHWPLFSLAKPGENVLIIGGGDCGVAREVLRHDSVRALTMVEIDKAVVDLCRRHIPSVMSGVFEDPRFRLEFCDGAEFIRARKKAFDVIIIDSTDPIGPARSLFNTDFYRNVYEALKDGGIAIHQTGALILQPYECPGSWRQMERIFDSVRVVQFTNVSYMGGPFSLTAGSRGKTVFQAKPSQIQNRFKQSGIKTRWYSPDISAVPYPEFQRRLETDKYGEEIIIDIALPKGERPNFEEVKRWSRDTCEAIRMKPFGKPNVSSPVLDDGDTLVQYIETSAISYRRYGDNACLNCFTCDRLPARRVVDFSSKYFRAGAAVCWHIPRGSFSGLKDVQKQSLLYKVSKSSLKNRPGDGTVKTYHPRLTDPSELFSEAFLTPVETGLSSAYELILDVYGCDYSAISSCAGVAHWAGVEFPRVANVTPIGAADAPDFGHAKKKTSGPSVTQLFCGGSNISHYSENWLMIVINIVLTERIPLRKAIESTLAYFKGTSAVGWIIPRGLKCQDMKTIANQTLIFRVGS